MKIKKSKKKFIILISLMLAVSQFVPVYGSEDKAEAQLTEEELSEGAISGEAQPEGEMPEGSGSEEDEVIQDEVIPEEVPSENSGSEEKEVPAEEKASEDSRSEEKEAAAEEGLLEEQASESADAADAAAKADAAADGITVSLYNTGTPDVSEDFRAYVEGDPDAEKLIAGLYDSVSSVKTDLCIRIEGEYEDTEDYDLTVQFGSGESTDESADRFTEASEDVLYFVNDEYACPVCYDTNEEERTITVPELSGPGSLVFVSDVVYAEDESGMYLLEEQESTDAVSETGSVKAESVSINTSLKYPYAAKGSTIKFTASVSPKEASQKVKWTSSNTKVAKVNSDGSIYAGSKGSAVISAEAADGSGKKASYTLKVVAYRDTPAKCVAHRGFRSIAPENTRPAFEMALKAGYDSVECDVFKTKDGVFVISHDDRLVRVFGVEKRISQSTYNSLYKLVAVNGNGVKDYPNEHLMKFEDYLSIMAGNDKSLIIEVKQQLTQSETDRLYRLLSSYELNGQMQLAAGKTQLERIAKSIKTYKQEYPVGPKLMVANPKDPTVVTGWYGKGKSAITYASDHGYGLFVKKESLTKEIVKKAHKAGVIVSAWDVWEFDQAYHLAYDLKVDEVVCNTDLTHPYFKDVPITHSFYTPVYWAAGRGITTGYTDGSGNFGVRDDITRGQFVTFLWRIAGWPAPKGKKQTFKDVPVTSAYYQAIQWAYEKGITAGYKNKNFGINDPCTRGQIATFLWRYSGNPAPRGKTKTFKDVPVKHAYYRAIQWAYENKITTGYKDGNFGVTDTCTRGQCMTFLYRLSH